MAEFKKIIIAQDHRLFREGLKALLSDNQELDVIGEAGDGLETISCAREHKADLMILDLSMPNWAEFQQSEKLKENFQKSKFWC